MLLDNATIHRAPQVKKVIEELKLPVEFAGEAAFKAIPIEAIFGFVKKRYTSIMGNKCRRQPLMELSNKEGKNWS